MYGFYSSNRRPEQHEKSGYQVAHDFLLSIVAFYVNHDFFIFPVVVYFILC